MAANISATAVRNSAYNMVRTQEVQKIVNASYSLEEYNDLKKDIIAAARSVPSTQNGGEYGHVWLVIDEEAYKNLIKDASFVVTRKTNPGLDPKVKQKDSHAEIAR